MSYPLSNFVVVVRSRHGFDDTLCVDELEQKIQISKIQLHNPTNHYPRICLCIRVLHVQHTFEYCIFGIFQNYL